MSVARRVIKARERTELKIVASEKDSCATIQPEEISGFLLSLRHTLLMQLASLDKTLKLERRCKNCGHSV